jgi:membrane-associated phospholipid phosphatase
MLAPGFLVDMPMPQVKFRLHCGGMRVTNTKAVTTGYREALAAAADRHRAALVALALLVSIAVIWSLMVELTIRGGVAVGAEVVTILVVGIVIEATAVVAFAEAGGSAPWFARLARTGEAIAGLAVWIGLVATIGVISYLCAKLSLPLHDAQFIAMDQGLGFDWLRWFAFVNRHPMLAEIFRLSYGTLLLQLFITFGVATLCRDRRRLAEFCQVIIVAAVITCIVSGMLPAIGAKPYFGIPGANWIDDLRQLREAGPAFFNLDDLQGIVTMPSYHTASGVIFMWSTRRTGIVSLAMIVLNVVMITSTLTEGGHYLVDVLGGIAVAVASIGLVRLGFRWRSALPRAGFFRAGLPGTASASG